MLKPRGRALRWCTKHRGITEQPAGSNTDNRQDGIRKMQVDCAGGGSWLVPSPWCGSYSFGALKAAGVKGLNSRIASVAFIEDDAKAHRGCFRGWVTLSDPNWPKKVRRGDLVVLFGRGVHVEVVRSAAWVYRKRGYIRTEGGNTTPEGGSGNQANGGGAYPRRRPLSSIHGYAVVNYPEK